MTCCHWLDNSKSPFLCVCGFKGCSQQSVWQSLDLIVPPMEPSIHICQSYVFLYQKSQLLENLVDFFWNQGFMFWSHWNTLIPGHVLLLLSQNLLELLIWIRFRNLIGQMLSSHYFSNHFMLLLWVDIKVFIAKIPPKNY